VNDLESAVVKKTEIDRVRVARLGDRIEKSLTQETGFKSLDVDKRAFGFFDPSSSQK
jgi:hypothetical protein